MGFGTLFIGYFLILNVTYYGFSDIIAASVMLFGLYKLSGINHYFKKAFYATGVFSIFALYELVVFVLDMFSIADYSYLLTATAAMRHLIICICTVTMLLGMRDVCHEVDLPVLEKRCHRSVLVSFIIYALSILVETQGLFQFIETIYVAWLALFTLLASLMLTVFNLYCIHSCYRLICMPDEKRSDKRKAPAFVEAFKRHEEEKQREYIEYKLEKRRRKAEKNVKNENGKKK